MEIDKVVYIFNYLNIESLKNIYIEAILKGGRGEL